MSAVKNALEGKPFHSPVHTALVHFPLACFSLGVILNIASRFVSNPSLQLGACAFWATTAGIATALLAAVFGFVDYTSIRDDHPGKKAATAHMLLNLVAVAVYAVSVGLRWSSKNELSTPTVPLILDLAGYATLMVSGYLGGHLVYNDGVGVGRHRHKPPLPERTITLQVRAAEFVRVGRFADLESGEALRVSINGVVMAITRDGDRLYAVQEFCTHRFGPLSEGKIENGCVTCPWHGSRFSLDDGSVVEKPAKVKLKTFAVEVRDGGIWVRAPDRAAPSQSIEAKDHEHNARR